MRDKCFGERELSKRLGERLRFMGPSRLNRGGEREREMDLGRRLKGERDLENRLIGDLERRLMGDRDLLRARPRGDLIGRLIGERDLEARLGGVLEIGLRIGDLDTGLRIGEIGLLIGNLLAGDLENLRFEEGDIGLSLRGLKGDLERRLGGVRLRFLRPLKFPLRPLLSPTRTSLLTSLEPGTLT